MGADVYLIEPAEQEHLPVTRPSHSGSSHSSSETSSHAAHSVSPHGHTHHTLNSISNSIYGPHTSLINTSSEDPSSVSNLDSISINADLTDEDSLLPDKQPLVFGDASTSGPVLHVLRRIIVSSSPKNSPLSHTTAPTSRGSTVTEKSPLLHITESSTSSYVSTPHPIAKLSAEDWLQNALDEARKDTFHLSSMSEYCWR